MTYSTRAQPYHQIPRSKRSKTHPSIQAWLDWVDQFVYAISQTFIKLLPIILPLPMVGLITYDMHVFVLPFENGWMRAILAGVAAVGFEFFGASSLDVAREAKAYGVRRRDHEPEISPFWGNAGLWIYVLVAFLTITVTGVIPNFSPGDPQTYPFLLQYAFVVLIPFGYQFLMLHTAIREVDELREDEQAAKIQAEAATFSRRTQELDLRAREAEIAEKEAGVAQQRAQAEAIRRKAEAEKIKAQAELAARQHAPQSSAPHGAPIRASPPPTSNSSLDWRRGSFEKLEQALAAGAGPEQPNATDIRRLRQLAEAFGTQIFTKPQAAEVIDMAANSALMLLKLGWANEIVHRDSNNTYWLDLARLETFAEEHRPQAPGD